MTFILAPAPATHTPHTYTLPIHTYTHTPAHPNTHTPVHKHPHTVFSPSCRSSGRHSLGAQSPQEVTGSGGTLVSFPDHTHLSQPHPLGLSPLGGGGRGAPSSQLQPLGWSPLLTEPEAGERGGVWVHISKTLLFKRIPVDFLE